MKILCALSGIEYKCDHFSLSLTRNETAHPIFSLPTKDLLGKVFPNWIGQRLSESESRLLFVGLLKASEHVTFNAAATPAPATVAIFMERLAKTVSWIDMIKVPSLVLPSFVINHHTSKLENIGYFLDSWDNARAAFEDGYRTQDSLREQLRRETALEKLIKNPSKVPENYALMLSEWAAIAGNFPESTTEIAGVQISLREYWKSIIRACGRSDISILSINQQDLSELIEECEMVIPHGSIYAAALMNLLRHTKNRYRNALGFNDTYLDESDSVFRKQRGVPFQIVDTIEEATIAAIAIGASESAPIRSDYQNDVEFLKAKIKYRFAQKQAAITDNQNRRAEDAAVHTIKGDI